MLVHRSARRGLCRAAAVGLSVLTLAVGPIGLTVASSETPSPVPPAPSTSASPAPTPTPTPTSSVPTTSTSYSLKPDEFGLTVSPARLVVSADELSRTQQVTVVNRGQASLALTVQKRNFVPQADGSLRWEKDAPYAAASWVDVQPSAFTVASGATQIVTADITVPTDPEPGDHQVALVFLVPTTGGDGNVSVNRGVATPIYVTVPGPVDDSVAPLSLDAPGLSLLRRVPLDLKVHNSGTVHRDFRGDQVLRVDAAGIPTAFPDFTVPRGATRDVTTSWKAPLVCVCHVTVSVPATSGAAQALTVRVVVLPWYVISAVVGIAALAVLTVVLVRRRRRRRRVVA